jgi:hypothetical protein
MNTEEQRVHDMAMDAALKYSAETLALRDKLAEREAYAEELERKNIGLRNHLAAMCAWSELAAEKAGWTKENAGSIWHSIKLARELMAENDKINAGRPDARDLHLGDSRASQQAGPDGGEDPTPAPSNVPLTAELVALLRECYPVVGNQHYANMGTHIAKPGSLKRRIRDALDAADVAHSAAPGGVVLNGTCEERIAEFGKTVPPPEALDPALHDRERIHAVMVHADYWRNAAREVGASAEQFNLHDQALNGWKNLACALSAEIARMTSTEKR